MKNEVETANRFGAIRRGEGSGKNLKISLSPEAFGETFNPEAVCQPNHKEMNGRTLRVSRIHRKIKSSTRGPTARVVGGKILGSELHTEAAVQIERIRQVADHHHGDIHWAG